MAECRNPGPPPDEVNPKVAMASPAWREETTLPRTVDMPKEGVTFIIMPPRIRRCRSGHHSVVDQEYLKLRDDKTPPATLGLGEVYKLRRQAMPPVGYLSPQ